MKNILLTGGAGFIGSHVGDILIDNGYAVTVLDNLSFGKRENIPKKCEFIEADIIDREKIFSTFESHSFDTIIHLAAIHFIPYCNKHPNLACRTNIEGTQNILDAAQKKSGIEKIFVASTAAVYPDMPHAILESTLRAPLDVYGMTKAANEEQVRIYGNRSGAKVCIGRFFNAVGGRETNPHLVPDILARIQSSNTIKIGNTSPKRDYIDVRDMATAVMTYLNRAADPIDTCNIGTGSVFNVDEIVNIISNVHGKDITLEPSQHLTRKVERENLQADNTRIRNRYGWSPKYSINESIAYAYEWFMESNR